MSKHIHHQDMNNRHGCQDCQDREARIAELEALLREARKNLGWLTERDLRGRIDDALTPESLSSHE